MRALFTKLKAAGAANRERTAKAAQAAEPGTEKSMHAAICIPFDDSNKLAYLLGVQWTPHLTSDALFTAAIKNAREVGASHVYTKPKGRGENFGVVRIEDRDAKTFEDLVPLAVAFAGMVQDKNVRAIFVLDLRGEEHYPDGIVYVAAVLRGNPIKEVFCTTDTYTETVKSLAADSRTGVNVYVDSPRPDVFDGIAREFPSASVLHLHSIQLDPVDAVKRPPTVNFKKGHAIFLGLVLLAYLGATSGVDYYRQNVMARSEEQTLQMLTMQYVAKRQQAYKAGFVSSADSAVTAVLGAIKALPRIRGGWEFSQAVCQIGQSSCTLTWKRIYGTYDTFIEGTSPERVRLSAADFRTLKETLPIKVEPSKQPAMGELPTQAAFDRINGDRADTFDLAGIKTYKVEAMQDLVSWTGKGTPPAPVVGTAGWEVLAPIDQIEEMLASQRIGQEFGVNTITVEPKNGEITLKVQGKVYVRKK